VSELQDHQAQRRGSGDLHGSASQAAPGLINTAEAVLMVETGLITGYNSAFPRRICTGEF
jgi:hypothetical protein